MAKYRKHPWQEYFNALEQANLTQVSVRQTHIAYGRQLCGSNSLIFDARCVGNLSITSFK
jgi:hypothetical protein